MDFSTTSFWYSLIPAIILLLCGNRILKEHQAALQKFHKCIILVLSLTLLGLASWQTLGIFLTVMMTAWISCRLGLSLGKTGRKVLIGCQIIVLLLPLLYFKYADFICNGIGGCEWDSLRGLIIPIGISFYTFQIIGFCIDTLMRDEPMPRFVDYMNFGCFFPQIVAGPIERRSDLLPQMENLRLFFTSANLRDGVPYIILGLFFKLALADNIAVAFWQDYAGTNALIIWLNNFLFTFRIYFDFAGYGLTAYGIARCVGITLRMNFLSPYTACNINEFWRRWHTSLTLWFRDYIYFSLGGSRTKRWALNILIIMLISGVWHGAGWNFIIWGALAGVAMIIHRLWSKAGLKLPAFIGWGFTFSMMVLVWMFFYDTKAELLTQHLQIIATPDAYSPQVFVKELMSRNTSGAMAFPFLMLSACIILLEFVSLRVFKEPYKIFLTPPACGIMVFLIYTLHTGVKNQFIYFAF